VPTKSPSTKDGPAPRSGSREGENDADDDHDDRRCGCCWPVAAVADSVRPLPLFFPLPLVVLSVVVVAVLVVLEGAAARSLKMSRPGSRHLRGCVRVFFLGWVLWLGGWVD
jgi:hypothetical protein